MNLRYPKFLSYVDTKPTSTHDGRTIEESLITMMADAPENWSWPWQGFVAHGGAFPIHHDNMQ
jgi:hypothetical protein